MKNIIFIICLTSISNLFSQESFKGNYYGSWATTFWEFEFLEDGNYTRVSKGHYGHTEVNGRYKVYGDTLEILTGYDSSHGTISQYYLIENSIKLIDLSNGYDYIKYSKDEDIFFSSRVRLINYPYTKPKPGQKEELNLILKKALSHKKVKQYLHLDEQPIKKQISVKKFHQLAIDFKVNGVPIKTSSAQKNNKIEFSSITFGTHVAEFDFSIPSEGTKFRITCTKIDDNWKVSDIVIVET